MSKALAIIPARGGSKRIPRKNIKDFLGFPIIKYSIEAALESGSFAEVMVSTDDAEIAEIAGKLGAKVPFLRSEKTSNDFATTAEVIEEVLVEYKKRGQEFECCCSIYPTAPFISADKLKKGYRLLQESNADAALAVVRYAYPIQRALKIENERVEMIMPENLSVRSQDLPPAYHDAGQYYWFKVKAFLKNSKILSPNMVAIEVPGSEVQDIDNEDDWKIAEMKYEVMHSDNRGAR